MDETLAGFGGDVKFLRTKLSAAYYKPLLFKSVILGVSGKLGYVTGLGDNVTQSQRFNLGGRDVRGFGSGGIGPRDTGSSDAVGGNKMYAGSLEVVSSLGLVKDTGIRWAVFTDFGSLWGTDYPSGVTKPNAADMRISAGVGISGVQPLAHCHFLGQNHYQKWRMTHQKLSSSILEPGCRHDKKNTLHCDQTVDLYDGFFWLCAC